MKHPIIYVGFAYEIADQCDRLCNVISILLTIKESVTFAESAVQDSLVYLKISIFVYVENHFDIALCSVQPFPDGINRYLRRSLIREHKDTGGDTAEGNAFQVVFFCQVQTGCITGCKKAFVLLCQRSVNDRADCVQNILTGQIISRSDFCLTGWFLMTLCVHDLVAAISETRDAPTPRG